VKAPAIMAATRDAGFLDRPDTWKPKRYHVLTPEGLHARCGQMIIPNDDDTWPAATIAPIQRCRKNGCRQAWPPVTQGRTK
jgi:hypothetical protein